MEKSTEEIFVYSFLWHHVLRLDLIRRTLLTAELQLSLSWMA